MASRLTSLPAAMKTDFFNIMPPLWATVPEVLSLPKPEQSGFVNSNGARLYYAAFNHRGGSPVILLHGGFASSESWGFEVPRLADNHEVIVMDNRGHGRSGISATPLSYEQMTSDVIAVLDAMHIRKVSVVGLSDGGIIGLILGFRYPGRGGFHGVIVAFLGGHGN
jgi:pimeloyl-ACP methyl ester carboxylesterase